MKKLYKSKNNRIIEGVCGGIAEYFNVDPTLIRVCWIILGCMAGCGLIAYILCAIIVPYEK